MKPIKNHLYWISYRIDGCTYTTLQRCRSVTPRGGVFNTICGHTFDIDEHSIVSEETDWWTGFWYRLNPFA